MRTFALFAVLLLIWLGAGCLNFEPKADTTRFFVLSTTNPNATTNRLADLGGAVVTRVFMPDYLYRRSLAVRKGPSEIVFADTVQWAEPLDRGMARVLTENLRAYARPSESINEIEVTVQRFDVSLEGDVTLQAEWGEAGGGERHSGRFAAQGPAPATDPAGTIETMNQALELLARRIAEGEG